MPKYTQITVHAHVLHSADSPVDFSCPDDVHNFFTNFGYQPLKYSKKEATEDYGSILKYFRTNKRFPWIHVCPFSEEIHGRTRLVFSDSEQEAIDQEHQSAMDI